MGLVVTNLKSNTFEVGHVDNVPTRFFLARRDKITYISPYEIFFIVN